MTQCIVQVKSINKITHDVVSITTEKPAAFEFNPGQATEIAIDKAGWQDEKRPFTFTSLPANDYLEFTIKTYPKHKGVTNELLNLKPGDKLILNEVFGAITYEKEGVFIAGGAGITPFISIFRYLQSKQMIGNNSLVFANKTKADIILEGEFSNMLGDSFINILSDEQVDGYHYGMISKDFLVNNCKDLDRQFYVCGPPPMMDAVLEQLEDLGVDENGITVEI